MGGVVARRRPGCKPLDTSDVEFEVVAARVAGHTRREIAKLAGYSSRIVSRILSRHPEAEEAYSRWLSEREKVRIVEWRIRHGLQP